jgi:hypothetical protein
VGDHRIIDRVRVFGDVEVFLDDTARVGEERPMGADSAAIFVRLRNIVGANGNEPAIGDLELTMECNEPFSLPAVLRTVSSSAEDENHRMLSLQRRELSAFRGVVGKLKVREDRARNNLRSHSKGSSRASVRSCLKLVAVHEADGGFFSPGAASKIAIARLEAGASRKD